MANIQNVQSMNDVFIPDEVLSEDQNCLKQTQLNE